MFILTNISYDVDGQVFAGHPELFKEKKDAETSARRQLAEDFDISLEDVENYAQEGGTPYVLSMSRDGHFEAYTVAEIPV